VKKMTEVDLSGQISNETKISLAGGENPSFFAVGDGF